MKKIKLLVVGPGLIGKKHIELLKNVPLAELAALVAPDHAKHHEFAHQLSVPLFHSITDCFSQTDVDGVIISSPNQVHAQQARQCIEAGIPVLVEKPFTDNVSEGEALADLAAQLNAKVLVGHHRAHSPLLATARNVIEQGRLGRLVSIMGSAQFYKPVEYFEAGPWRKLPGGGPILINLIHEIGNLRSLCGEISAVQAFSSSNVRGFAVEDTVAINLAFKNGALGTFMLSDVSATPKSWEQTSRENPSYASYADEDCYTVSGTRGSLSVPTMRLKTYATEEDASWWKPFAEESIAVNRLDPLKCQLEHFLDVIKGTAEPLVSASDGLRNLQITEAVRRSALNRQIVEV